MNRRKFHIFLIFLSVAALLARPFVVYQIAAQKSFAGDPQKVNNLFQRLIKKKEDHYAVMKISCTETKQSPVRLQQPVKFIDRFLQNSNRSFVIVFPANNQVKSLQPHAGRYYTILLVSRLQV